MAATGNSNLDDEQGEVYRRKFGLRYVGVPERPFGAALGQPSREERRMSKYGGKSKKRKRRP